MSVKEMRAIYGEWLAAEMKKNENIVVIDADLARANGTLSLRDKFPGRSFDVGVAESNMASVAAGMASYGYIPFIGTFCPFATRRICDQIAISIAYAGMNVKIVGTDPGVSAEMNGGTHLSVEDVGVLRSIPGMVIFEPVDGVQLKSALPQIAAYEGPVYMRLFRKVMQPVFDEASYKFDLFKADVLREGKDISLFASGLMLPEALKATKMLAADGISAEVVNIHTIKPLDTETVLRSVRKTGVAVTCENHNVIGGLGSAVAETLCREYPAPMRMVGIQDRFGVVGTLPYLMEKMSLTAENIYTAAIEAVKLKKQEEPS
ncbi:MAG: transketolase family protein [Oscillospiraceae bacterium]|nr:transketolase family protein [Oscillospiraceae bacterium]